MQAQPGPNQGQVPSEVKPVREALRHRQGRSSAVADRQGFAQGQAGAAKGKKVQLTAKLTYKSALGGTPTVKVFHFTVTKKKKKHH
jgi:hypothetical protein